MEVAKPGLRKAKYSTFQTFDSNDAILEEALRNIQ